MSKDLTRTPRSTSPTDVLQHIPVDWLTESEAATYCRCSEWSFRRMRLPAYNAGGRKVYHRSTIDAAIFSRPWQPSTNVATPTTSTGETRASRSVDPSERLTGKRLRPFVPRKRKAGGGSAG